VLTAMIAMRGSPPASVEPGLKPNHPNARMNVPITTRVMLWPGMGRALPSGPYLPARGPKIFAPTNAETPPTMCTTELPAKSTCPWPRPKFLPNAESHPPPHTQFA
jgi:hypothetical protein